MRYFKEAWKGLVFILVLILFNAIFWLTATPIFAQPIESTVAQMMGALILIGFTLVFFLATKNTVVNYLFKGLENVYITHRVLAMIAFLMIIVHSQSTNLIFAYFRPDYPFDAAAVAPLARNLFFGLIVLALLAKYLKYEHWRTIHRFMIIPYLIASYHAFFLSSYELISVSFLGIWMMGMIAIGTASSFYMIVLYRRTAFTYQGVVQSVTYLNDSVTEIELKMSETYPYKSGQFAFVKINREPFKGIPHPFSISGKEEDSVFFTIKALGDFTQDLKDHLKEGDTMHLTKAYGHMTFEDYPSPQVWIAGGIGITPFLSHLRTQTVNQNIDLYYSVRHREDAVHLDYFKKLDKELKNFHLHYSESDKDGFLSLNKIDLSHQPTVFLCGPVPMAKALKKELRNNQEYRQLVFEAFSFTGTLVEDSIAWLKRLKRRITKKNP